ncbi:hypothetical protein NA56DRAFT_699013 [Hyaloscypha hepaticicola]|uniref:Uncharacterized protein n=1 Tax=Hyaloscypha hepaticicola TaxID=2082293 RepID=A0A2J6QI45_9HELO|nr:hypothetical protein NA56DRAFT_699013 [Hyaloscypha hepaticicola]
MNAWWSDVRVDEVRRMLDVEILEEDGPRSAVRLGYLASAEWDIKGACTSLAIPSTSRPTRLSETNGKPEHAPHSLLLASSRSKVSLSIFHSSIPSGGTSMAESTGELPAASSLLDKLMSFLTRICWRRSFLYASTRWNEADLIERTILTALSHLCEPGKRLGGSQTVEPHKSCTMSLHYSYYHKTSSFSTLFTACTALQTLTAVPTLARPLGPYLAHVISPNLSFYGRSPARSNPHDSNNHIVGHSMLKGRAVLPARHAECLGEGNASDAPPMPLRCPMSRTAAFWDLVLDRIPSAKPLKSSFHRLAPFPSPSPSPSPSPVSENSQ